MTERPHVRNDGTRFSRRVIVAGKPHARGFSLLEVLVAFVILALVGTALFRLFSGALGNVALADEYSRATLYAESRLAALPVEAPVREGGEQGTSTDGRYAWATRIEPYVPPDSTPDLERAGEVLPIRLWRLAVTVSWSGAAGASRSVTLATVRLGPKQ